MPFDDRTRILLGDGGVDRLASATVCVFGLGGVGAAAAMDLARVGVGSLVAVDFDEVSESNLNRLYFGYAGDIGRPKVDAFADYARRVNPGIRIETRGSIVSGAQAADSVPAGCDYYLDCIDTLNPKVNLMAALAIAGLPFASSMGTAGRMAPERLRIGSLWDTRDCPLSALVRKRLRRLGFYKPGTAAPETAPEDGATADPVLSPAVRTLAHGFPCVWSDEPAVQPAMPADGSTPGDTVDGVRVRAVQGSGPFVPQAAGHMLASIAVRSILGIAVDSTKRR